MIRRTTSSVRIESLRVISSSSGLVLDGLTYELGVDFDPSAATNFLVFDPIAPSSSPVGYFDHNIGTNATTEDTDSVAGDASTYATLLANNNVAQNSWRLPFFSSGAPLTYDPSVVGIYDVYLRAFDGNGRQVASTSIQTLIGVPEPATLGLFGIGLAAVGFARKRRR